VWEGLWVGGGSEGEGYFFASVGVSLRESSLSCAMDCYEGAIEMHKSVHVRVGIKEILGKGSSLRASLMFGKDFVFR
jgi:hypothetical protein